MIWNSLFLLVNKSVGLDIYIHVVNFRDHQLNISDNSNAIQIKGVY